MLSVLFVLGYKFNQDKWKVISLVMLLYAGKASRTSFKYFIFLDTVKKLKQWSQSAGKTNINSRTSETIRNSTEHIKNISIHVPRHLKPLNDEQLGHYLAGLIDGDGHFSSQQQLVIVFSSTDIQLAYYIKKTIGYGYVRKVQDQNDYLYIISNKDGILKVIHLINNKLRTVNKYNQVTNFLKDSNENLEFGMNNTKAFANYWIAGFSDADGSFHINILNREERSKPEIRLNFQIVASEENSLLLIKEAFGGNIGYSKSHDTYFYGSTSWGSAKKVISYFDTYHLQSSKYLHYLKWRKVYIMLQSQDHLTELSLGKIQKIQKSMNRSLV